MTHLDRVQCTNQYRLQPVKGISFVIPARNEERTIADVVKACFGAGASFGAPFEVIVCSDGSFDTTAVLATQCGATVFIRDSKEGSKAEALSSAICRASFETIFAIDADCINLRPEVLLRMLVLASSGDVTMVTGTFDYGPLSWIVQRNPWSTGQRILNGRVFEAVASRAKGYNIELLINEFVGQTSGSTISMCMKSVTQRSRRQKLGWRKGVADTLRMWHDLSRQALDLDQASYRQYMRRLNLATPSGSESISLRRKYVLLA